MENKKIFSEVYQELRIFAFEELIKEYSDKNDEIIVQKLTKLKQIEEQKKAQNRAISAPNLSQNSICKINHR